MRKINVSEFCNQSNLNEDAFRDILETMNLSRDTRELDLEILEAIAQEIAQQNGTHLALNASVSTVNNSDKIAIKEAVSLTFEFYSQELAINDLQVVQLAAFINAQRQATAYETIHSAVISQRMTDYRTKTNSSLLSSIQAVEEVSDADFLAVRGFHTKTITKDSVLDEFLKM